MALLILPLTASLAWVVGSLWLQAELPAMALLPALALWPASDHLRGFPARARGPLALHARAHCSNIRQHIRPWLRQRGLGDRRFQPLARAVVRLQIASRPRQVP